MCELLMQRDGQQPDMTTWQADHMPLLVCQLQLQVGEDVDYITNSHPLPLLPLAFSSGNVLIVIVFSSRRNGCRKNKSTCKTAKAKLQLHPRPNQNTTLCALTTDLRNVLGKCKVLPRTGYEGPDV